MAGNTSFLPEDYLEARIARRTNLVCLTLFAVVMGCVLAAYFITDQQRDEVKKLQAQVNQQFEEEAKRIQRIEQLQEQKKQMVQKANVTSALIERVPRSLLLAELINHMPATMSLLEMELESRQVKTAAPPMTAMEKARARVNNQAQDEAPDQPPPTPKTEITVHLVGVAPTDVEVAKFLAELGSHDLFYDPNLQFSEQTTLQQREMRKFRVNMKINQDLDLDSLEPTLVKRGLKMNPMNDTLQIGADGVKTAPANVIPARHD